MTRCVLRSLSIYPPVPQGTAGTAVPAMADLISWQTASNALHGPRGERSWSSTINGLRHRRTKASTP